MRQKRAKTYRKLLATYIRHFGLRPPLQVLIDASMANTMASMKMSADDVYTRLESVLQVSAALPSSSRPQQQYGSSLGGSLSRSKAASLIKPMITQCCITELYKDQKKGEQEARAVELAKGWERRFCSHKEPLSGDRCMRDVIGDRNKHRYVLAANSVDLRNALRHTVAGVAVVHVNDHKVLVMEPMSDLTRQRCEELEREKLKAIGGSSSGKRTASGAPLANVLDGSASLHADATLGATLAEPGPPLKRKKKAKEPNPLSMKKAKKPDGKGGSAGQKKGKKTSSASARGKAAINAT